MTLGDFLAIIRKIETGDKFGSKAVNKSTGDNGKALGPFQIHKPYFEDALLLVPKFYDEVVKHNDAALIILLYLWRYDRRRLLSLEVPADIAVRWACIHNGGPRGWIKKSTEPYAERFLNECIKEDLL